MRWENAHVPLICANNYETQFMPVLQLMEELVQRRCVRARRDRIARTGCESYRHWRPNGRSCDVGTRAARLAGTTHRRPPRSRTSRSPRSAGDGAASTQPSVASLAPLLSLKYVGPISPPPDTAAKVQLEAQTPRRGTSGKLSVLLRAAPPRIADEIARADRRRAGFFPRMPRRGSPSSPRGLAPTA